MFILNLTFLALFHATISVDPCQTPNGQNGNCKPMNQCPSALPQDEIPDRGKFLRQLHCGLDGNNPKVCCPIESPPVDVSELLPSPPYCGNEFEVKVQGGNITALDEFPWMALLMYRIDGELTHQCGGFLINKRYVMTARHCLRSDLVSVRLGEWDVRTDPDCVTSLFGQDCAPKVLEILIEKQIPHSGPRSIRQNDIALLRLSRDVEFNEFVSPVCLPITPDLMTKTYLGEIMIVAGWGKTETADASDVKLKVQVPVVDCNNEVLKKLRNANFISQELICAGGEKGKDACIGDSGGPLMHNIQAWYALGIVSAGLECGAFSNVPGLYVRVGGHIDWILSKIRP